MNSLKSLQSYGCFKLRMSGFPNFQRSQQYTFDLKCFEGARTCLRSSTTTPFLLGSDPPTGSQKTLSFFVGHACDVTLVNDGIWRTEIVHTVSPWSHCRTENILISLDRFVVVHTFNFLHTLPMGDTTKCQSPKNGKIWDFSLPDGDRLNWLRQNLAHKRELYVDFRKSNWALIGKKDWVQEPSDFIICWKNSVFVPWKMTQITNSNEILHEV